MGRCRVLVAIVPPRDLLDGARLLRRVLGDDRAERIVPHITVVPPINIDAERMEPLRRHLRDVTSQFQPFELSVESVSTFLPGAPTVHLDIGGEGLASLEEMRRMLMQGDLQRDENRPFRPHLTLRSRVAPPRIVQAIEVLSEAPLAFQPWKVERINLMELITSEGRGTRWLTIAQDELGPPTVVGRGGIELTIRATELLERGALALLEESALVEESALLHAPALLEEHDESACTSEETLVVTAEVSGAVGAPVGVAVGTAGPSGANLHAIVVDAAERGQGIGRHLVSQWCFQATRRGAPIVYASDRGGSEVLAATGFVAVGGLWVRQMSPDGA